MADISQFKTVAMLREELQRRGADTKGLKKVLQDRLLALMVSESPTLCSACVCGVVHAAMLNQRVAGNSLPRARCNVSIQRFCAAQNGRAIFDWAWRNRHLIGTAKESEWENREGNVQYVFACR